MAYCLGHRTSLLSSTAQQRTSSPRRPACSATPAASIPLSAPSFLSRPMLGVASRHAVRPQRGLKCYALNEDTNFSKEPRVNVGKPFDGNTQYVKDQEAYPAGSQPSQNGPAPEGSPLASLQDLDEYPGDFKRRRWITFVGIVVGYACFYLTRNSLTYTAPVMVHDQALPGVNMIQIGALTSIFPIAYGFSKFASGVLGARTSPSYLLAFGLMATAAVNILFGFGHSMLWFSVCWTINGLLQGVGGPCCARILTSWYATKERGTYWGMWNIAHNLGGFTAPLLAGTAARSMGWKWGMWAPGIVGVTVGILLLLALRDSPEAIGYPPVEIVEGKAQAAGEEDQPKESLMTLLVNNVLKNPYIWMLAITYFFIYVVRQGVTSWFVFYLMKAKGVADAGAAAVRVSGLELGGLFGSLLAGTVSDVLIARDPEGGSVGKRIQVVMAYTLGVAGMLAAFWASPASMPWLQWATVFMIGFFLYGPQMLIGLCGAELLAPESVGASQGFLGWVAYLGAANAGIPLSIIVNKHGWNAYFLSLFVACGCALLLLAPMIQAKSYVQRQAADEDELKLKGA
ncbi:hypothetical protein WJX72_002066 [[Myrmecia] bisecta]|uniref:Major facilitator superfamily (MFS) profile domain-containing protein n=1 Tax=[Myrmecia] bisecta TaxID=41462 RepID=A0AAW1QEC5_9CHLO